MGQSQYTEWFVQLINARTKKPIDDDTGKYIVMTAGSAVLATIYSDNTGTAPAFVYNNVTSTMTNGVIRFWTASSVTTVDITGITGTGQAFFLDALTPSEHRLEIDLEKTAQTLVLPIYNYIPTPFVSASVTIYSSAGLGSIWSQGLSLPAKSVVKDCWAKIETLGTGSLVNFGVSGTPSGLLQQITGSVTGSKVCKRGLVATAGTATFYLGSLLCTVTGFMEHPYEADAATGLVFGEVTGTCLAARTGWIFLKYDKLPN